MRRTGSELIFSPSDLIAFMESEYVSWMERYNLEFPGRVRPDEESEEDQLVQAKGMQPIE